MTPAALLWCNHCDDNCSTIYDSATGYTCCDNCGKVLDQSIFSDDTTFAKTAGGASRATSMRMESVMSEYPQSRLRTLEKGKDEIYNITTHLQMGGGDSLVNEAHKFYEMALDKNFTRGRRTAHVAAACLYLVCRKMKKPYLLIDFSDCLQTNVYVLGAVFLQLCKVLFLVDHPLIQNLVDPSLFIHRFTERLLDKKNNGVSRFQRKNNAVSETALRIVASMKRDWMQTGRKPSGLCGAALYISALSHGLNYSKSDIVTIVHICEATLTKRLIEFENTESGFLTIEEFIARADELDEESNSNQLPVPGQVLCKHKGTEEPHFAHGLCRLCYDEFNKISGGLSGGAEPPAFQRAERQRMEKAAEEERTKKLGHDTEPCDTEHDSGHDMKEAGISAKDTPGMGYESSTSQGPKVTGEGTGSPWHQADDISACDGTQDLNDTAVDDEEETFSDIDDDEVLGYLHNEEEKRYKTVIWESMNREYLEEQAAKEAAAAKEGVDVSSKPGKERKRRRSEDANNPAQTAAEATYKVLNRKGHSSKINYEALDSLFDAEKEKRLKTGSDVEDYDADGMKTGIEDNGNALESRRAEAGDEAIQYEDDDYAVDDYGEYYGNGDGDYANDEGYDFEY